MDFRIINHLLKELNTKVIFHPIKIYLKFTDEGEKILDTKKNLQSNAAPPCLRQMRQIVQLGRRSRLGAPDGDDIRRRTLLRRRLVDYDQLLGGDGGGTRLGLDLDESLLGGSTHAGALTLLDDPDKVVCCQKGK